MENGRTTTCPAAQGQRTYLERITVTDSRYTFTGDHGISLYLPRYDRWGRDGVICEFKRYQPGPHSQISTVPCAHAHDAIFCCTLAYPRQGAPRCCKKNHCHPLKVYQYHQRINVAGCCYRRTDSQDDGL